MGRQISPTTHIRAPRVLNAEDRVMVTLRRLLARARSTQIFAVEVWRSTGPLLCFAPLVIEPSNRQVSARGITTRPNVDAMLGTLRCLLDPDAGSLPADRQSIVGYETR